MRWAGFLALLLGLASPLRAEWHEASSEHFLVYADDDPRDVERFAQMLERYHTALTVLTGRKVPTPSPSNRVTIFAVGGERDMRRLSGSRDVAGFYVPRAGRSRAFVPNIRFKRDETDFSLTVLLHEYAHHFLIGSSRHAMPYWLSEGAAEFLASAFFPENGSVQIGRPAYHRAAEIVWGDRLPVRKLLDQKPDQEESNSFYGRSWLLYHYLFFDKTRGGQLAVYWQAVARGTPSLVAAEEAFGDLAQLEKDLTAYQKQRRISFYSLAPTLVAGSPVNVRKVSAGFGEMLPLVITSQRGVNREQALELLPQVRTIAAKHPGDADVLAALAEAEFDAGNADEAIAAADRALAIEPSVKNALVQKGFALFNKAATAPDGAAAYRTAMAPFTALNRLENDHPLPLIFYYRSFTSRGAEPDEQARLALERAAELGPFDQSLWMEAAVMQAREGRIEIARATLAPLAANPHGGSVAEFATRLMAALDHSPEGEPFDFRKLDEAGAGPAGQPAAAGEAGTGDAEGADAGAGAKGASGRAAD